MAAYFNTIKLNGNYTGHPHFKYALEYTGTRARHLLKFLKTRVWLHDRFGPSAEIDIWLHFYSKHIISNDYEYDSITKSWAWQTTNHKLRIYVRDDAILSHFLLSQVDT